MSSTARSSSSGRLAVRAPASMASLPSTRKQVVRWRGSSPPEQPSTRSFIARSGRGELRARASRVVPELRLHLEEIEELVQLRNVRHEEAAGLDGEDPGLHELRDDLVRLLGPDAHARVQLLRDDVELVPGGSLRDLLRRDGKEVQDAGGGVREEQVRDLL